MIYLDYSATTKVKEEVLDSFCKASLTYIGNPNSVHRLGVEAKQMIALSTAQIAKLLKVKDDEIIYTSESSESNNLAIKGVAFQYQKTGKHILTTPLEHSSILGPLNYLQQLDFEIEFLSLDEHGLVDLEDLQSKLRNDTILVTITDVNSELGLRQPLLEISKLIHQKPQCFFHVDMTQSVGKVPVSLEGIDLASFSAHKFGGIKGIGCLVKKENVRLQPLIHGGKSTTIYRSGTPALPLIVSLAKALRLALENLGEKVLYVTDLNQFLRDRLEKYPKVTINSNQYGIPHILNFSILGIPAETFVHALEAYDIFISTQSACANLNTLSKAVMAVTHQENRAKASLRLSLSDETRKEELEEFMKCFDLCYHRFLGEK